MITDKETVHQYKCPQCNEIFPLPGALKCHFRNHGVNEPKIPFSCNEQGCQFSSSDRQAFEGHLTSEHALPLVTCTFRSCKVAFSSKEEMEKHWRNHMPFHCPLCQFVTAHAKHLIEHCSEHKRPPVPQGAKGTSIQTSSQLTGSGRAKRTRKRATSHSVIQQEIEEESEGQQQLVKKAKENISIEMTEDFASLPSKDRIHEGTEHIYRTHMCSECRRCFKMRSHLLDHLRLHFPEPSLQCPVCKHHFTSKSKLHVHMLREAGQKPHRCHLCEYTTVERHSLRRHLASLHADEAGGEANSEVYPCPTCSRSFHQSSSLKAHMKTHLVPQDGQSVACIQEGCPFQSSDHKELRKHVSEVHRIKAVDCRHHACGSLFRTTADMEAHYRTHLPFHCSQCSYTCSNKRLFQHHRRRGHSGVDKLSCRFCSFITFNPVELQQHVGHLHANEKVHHCLQCTFVTAHKRVLARHLLMHSGDKPHKCSLCDFRCRDVTYLPKHMLTHSDNKNHMCAECGYVTKWKHYLNVHMRKHAGDLRFKCDQCSYRCHRTDQLNSHKLRHQAKSLICEVCGYACKRKYELRKHMQLKHSNKQGPPLPIFQCKYCTYSTCYRQALHNHENCKHTRVKEFRCALCPYSAYSSISLFLHKRKSHGYVPGDKGWQENYAKREQEINTAHRLTPEFYGKPSSTPRLREQPFVGPIETQKVNSSSLTGSADHHEAEQKDNAAANTVEDVRTGGAMEDSMSGSAWPVNSDETGITLVLTSVTDSQHTKTTHILSETVSQAVPMGTSANLDCAAQNTLKEIDTPALREVDGESVPMSEGVNKKKDLADDSFAEQVGKQVRELSETSEGTLITGLSELCSQTPSAESEMRLKAMRKQDGDQAEAMVMEGRVQMLVVESHGPASVHRCCQCTYVTHKQSSLEHHRKSVCQGRFKKLECQACWAQFKQRRGLDTHLLKKCPALSKPKRRSVDAATTCLTGNNDSVPCLTTPDGTNASPNERLNYDVTRNLFLGDKAKLNNSLNSTDHITIGTQSGEQENSLKIKRHAKVKLRRKKKVLGNQDKSGLFKKAIVGYTADKGRFACKFCSFTSRRSLAVERHSSTCRVACGMRGVDDESGNDSKEIEEAEEDYIAQNTGEVSKSGRNSSSRVSCPQCEFRCTSHSLLEAHQQNSHPPLEGATSQNSLNSCQSRETPPRTGSSHHQCQLCPFSSRKRLALARHLLDRHEDGPPGEKLLRCSSCEFNCHHQLVLEQHLRSHRGTRLYKCTDCNYGTPSRQKMTWHVRTHTGEKPYRCEQCGYACVDPSRLKYHMRIHQEERKYQCSQCDYTCKWTSQLKCHMTKHTGDKPYACEVCDYRTNRHDALQIHRDTQHRDSRPYICEQCGKSFKTVFLLQTHQRKHSDERPYVCGICQKGFRWPAGLRHHYLSHTNQQPFHCSQCPYRARQKFQVVKHLRKHHPDVSREKGVLRDPGAVRLTLQEARLGTLVVGTGKEEEEATRAEKAQQDDATEHYATSNAGGERTNQ